MLMYQSKCLFDLQGGLDGAESSMVQAHFVARFKAPPNVDFALYKSKLARCLAVLLAFASDV